MKKLFQLLFKLIKWILIFLGLVLVLIFIFAPRVDDSSTDEKSIEITKEAKKELSENKKIEEKIQRERAEYEKSVSKFESLKNQYKDFNGIYGETRKVSKEELRDYMVKVLYQNPECKPEYVDASVNSKKSYFVLCDNLEKIYWTTNDMETNTIRGFASHLSHNKAISYCESLIATKLINPSTFKRKTFDTSVAEVLQGRSHVYMGFSAKNGMGMEVDFRARCLVGENVAEIQLFEQV
jgi:RecG-like helicase|tara:strand:+ start:495 stop:1208 length:714 start_codon:yes stop_codon:yes gene_type:complete